LPVTAQTDTFSGRTPLVSASSQKVIVADSIAVLRAALAGRYTIEREIGRGGVAIVYLARDVKHDRYVALKRLRPELAASVGPVRFLQEIHIAAALQHPHILPLYDSGEAAGTLYYVMPFIEGAASLRDRLEREKQLSLDDALQVAREVAEGLSFAHSRGVIHRDVKPENILFAGGQAVISDFGIARALAVAGERITATGLSVGTPAYMSPEQAGGDDVDQRSDVYSLGCVLYEMLAGEPPFTGPSEQAIIARVLSERPRSLRVVRPTLPAAIERIVEKALAKVPADRFATAAEFAEALRNREVGGRTERRRIWRRAAALTSFVALLVAGAAWLGWGRQRTAAGPTIAALDPNRIAVLYFEDPGGTLRAVANGLTEDLIDELGRVEALHVIPPAGVKPYSGRSIPLDSIARALHVGTVVDGSVGRHGDSLRVTVRLVNAATGEQLESAALVRPWGNLFALQRDITQEVARILRVRLGREIQVRQQRAGTKSVAAWELVRRADELRQDAETLARTGDRHAASRVAELADSLLRRAETLDVKWSEPLVQRGWLARFRADLSFAARSGARGSDTIVATPPALLRGEAAWLQEALGYAEQALRVNPNDPKALELRGYLRFSLWEVFEEDPRSAADLIEGAENDLRAAVGLDPGLARAWYALSLVYHQKGDFAHAVVMLRRALEADAYFSDASRSIQLLMFASLEHGDVQQAASLCETGRTSFPDHPGFWECDLTILQWTVARAWRLLREIDLRDSSNILGSWAFRRTMVATVLARTGLADSARAVMRAARAAAPNAALLEGIELFEAYVYVLLGERDTALQALQTFVRTNPQSRTYVSKTRWFAPLHGDPRFRALVVLSRVPKGSDSAGRP
jgi:serine/threonine-protein kinase